MNSEYALLKANPNLVRVNGSHEVGRTHAVCYYRTRRYLMVWSAPVEEERQRYQPVSGLPPFAPHKVTCRKLVAKIAR